MPDAAQPPKSFKIVSIVITLWMLIGVLMFAADLMTTPAQAAASMSAAENELRDARPFWLYGVYAVATIIGLVGALLLLLRKPSAIPGLAISFVAVCVQFGFITFGMNAIALLGVVGATALPAFIVGVGAFSLWYAMQAKSKGWLG